MIITNTILYCVLHTLRPKMKLFEMYEFINVIEKMNFSEYTHERKRILELINGDMFFQIKLWPKKILMMFFHRPQSDRETMVVFLFLYGKFLWLIIR